MLRRTVLHKTLGLVALGLISLGVTLPAHAAVTPDAAKTLVDGMAAQAISTLAAPDRTDAQIRETFHGILQQNFDFDGIAKFVLGRYWRTATPEQQTEYLKLFGDYIVGIYANRFSQYSGETLSVGNVRQDGEDAIVSTRINLTRNPQPVAVDWKVTTGADGKPRVSDVIIEQVSMSITQRSEFASIIQSGGGQVEALLARLRAKTGAR